jgi:pimeloyl-ACP methyl ester carboxylesterase
VWNGEPNFLTKANPFERFRIGQGAGSWSADPAKMKVNAGSQFPVQAYDNFTKQIVPRWTTTDSAIIAAYTALVDKVCPCVLLFHSQAGGFGFTVAQARPDKIKAIVAVEPAVAGDKAHASKLKDIPTLWYTATIYRSTADGRRCGRLASIMRTPCARGETLTSLTCPRSASREILTC